MVCAKVTCGASSQADFILKIFPLKFHLKFSISSQPGWQAGTINVTLVCALSCISLIHKFSHTSHFFEKHFYNSSCWLKVINYPQKVLLGGTLWGGTSWVHQSSVIRRPEVDFLAFTLKVVLIVTTPIHRNSEHCTGVGHCEKRSHHTSPMHRKLSNTSRQNAIFKQHQVWKCNALYHPLPPINIMQMQMTQFLKNQCIIDVGIFWKA